MSDLNGVKGDTLCTGVGRIWVRTPEGVLVGGFAAEYMKKYGNQIVPEEPAREDAKKALHTSLMGEVNRRYNASEYQFSDPTYAIDYLQVNKKYGTSLVALCWVNYIFPQMEIAGNYLYDYVICQKRLEEASSKALLSRLQTKRTCCSCWAWRAWA